MIVCATHRRGDPSVWVTRATTLFSLLHQRVHDTRHWSKTKVTNMVQLATGKSQQHQAARQGTKQAARTPNQHKDGKTFRAEQANNTRNKKHKLDTRHTEHTEKRGTPHSSSETSRNTPHTHQTHTRKRPPTETTRHKPPEPATSATLQPTQA